MMKKKITLKYVIQLLYLNCSVSCCTMYMYPVNEHGEYSLFYMLQSFVYNTADEANMESMDLVGRIEDRRGNSTVIMGWCSST